jgi:mono/diheme cytochrome c family protein
LLLPSCRAAVAAIAIFSITATVSAETTLDDTKVEAGAMLYADFCSSCHGEHLRNASGGVTFDLRRLRTEDHARYLSVVLNGKNQMPPWRGVLGPDQIEAIWHYIRATLDRER